ncbi:hypothetical protein [Trinickia soli]|uniref:hypothetical protein n=1 Tax=Trinickia soli TaxID=380675 RepID=UPI003FA359EC
MPAAKAFAHLVSLVGIGLLARDESGAFNTGPLGLQLGLMALQRQAPERDADWEIAHLTADTGLTVAAAVFGPLGPTVVRLEESTQPMHVSLCAGTVVSLVHTAIGRLFAAHLGAEPLAGMLTIADTRRKGKTLRLAKAQAETETVRTGYESQLARIRRGRRRCCAGCSDSRHRRARGARLRPHGRHAPRDRAYRADR